MCSPARSSAASTACWPGTAAASAPTRPAQRSPASAACSRTTPAGCAAACTPTPTAPSRSLRFLLADGTEIDTAAPGAAERFASAAPALARGIAEIRDELRADTELAERVARKFEIKNTTGYRLCAFLDADEPLEIFRRLLIGSEGTLAFIGEAVFETVPLGRHTTLSLAFFEDVDAAVAAVPELVAAGASATELMVAPTLIAAAWNMPGTPERWKELPLDLGRSAGRVPRRRRGRARRAGATGARAAARA